MAQINETLERIADALRGVTKHEVEVLHEDTSVYVNFGYHEALIVMPADHGQWTLTAMAWDRTGGVSAELELGAVREEYLVPVARAFLEEQAREEAALEQALSEAFGE